MKTKRLAKFSAMMLLVMVVGAFALTPVTKAATSEQIEAAVASGLEWLADQQQPDGSWVYSAGSSYNPAVTGLVLLKFVDRAKELGQDPFDNDPESPTYYVYADNVIAGFDYLLNQITSTANGNTIGGRTQPLRGSLPRRPL